MKNLILIYFGIVLVREVAKYYKINSVEDAMKMVLPPLEEILPKTKTKELKHA